MVKKRAESRNALLRRVEGTFEGVQPATRGQKSQGGPRVLVVAMMSLKGRWLCACLYWLRAGRYENRIQSNIPQVEGQYAALARDAGRTPWT